MRLERGEVRLCRVPEGTAGETYLVVPVPEADAAVRIISGPDALPAHVTVLGPFAPVSALTDEVDKVIREVAAAIIPWSARFQEVRAFDDGTLWLAPLDSRPFRALITELSGRFPEHPPYGGRFALSEVIPHLTLEEGSALSPSDAAAALGESLPLTSRIETLEFWLIHPDGIEVVSRWP